MENLHTLTLMRHAKSSWNHTGIGDHDRPLNKRGLRDAPTMAKRLLSQGPPPDLIISSTAVRAVATAQSLLLECHQLDCHPDYREEPELYLASPQKMLHTISQQSLDARHIVLVAHNPGLEDLSAQLAQAEYLAAMPTAAIRQFSCSAWNTLTDGSRHAESGPESENVQTQLIYSDYPKKNAQPQAHKSSS